MNENLEENINDNEGENMSTSIFMKKRNNSQDRISFKYKKNYRLSIDIYDSAFENDSANKEWFISNYFIRNHMITIFDK